MQKCFALGIVTYKAGIGYEIFDAEQKRNGIVFREIGLYGALDDFFLTWTSLSMKLTTG
jgi:hypothetical protein